MLDKNFKLCYTRSGEYAREVGENVITIVDSHCGSGKTLWAIQYINELKDFNKILFITPFLSECERIQRSCQAKNFIAPDVKSGRGRKMNSFISLIQSGKNIVSTHSLFSNLDNDILNNIQAKNYTLIIDESMEILRKVNVYNDIKSLNEEDGEAQTYRDAKTLIEKNILFLSESGEISWNEDCNLKKYDYIKMKSKLNSLIMMNDSLLMWTFPHKMFKDNFFKEIYILTYQFDYQIQSYYFKYYDIPYIKKEVCEVNGNYFIQDYGLSGAEAAYRRLAKSLIEICDNKKINSVGRSHFNSGKKNTHIPLSRVWYDDTADSTNIVRKNMINYFKNITASAGRERMWTCFKKHQSKLANNIVAKRNFIALNARATNDFIDKKYLAYVVNRYLNPSFIQFFAQRGIHVDQDKFALSELIQWIWRSAIRNGEKIYLYIPSERMRCLLQNWLDN